MTPEADISKVKGAPSLQGIGKSFLRHRRLSQELTPKYTEQGRQLLVPFRCVLVRALAQPMF